MKNNKNTLIPFEGEHNFLSLRDAMNNLFDESFWSPFDHSLMSNFSKSNMGFPKVNISETEKEIVVTANVPGISSEDISVEINDNILTLSGQMTKENKEENKKYYRYERESGSFSRSFSLPVKVDEDKIEAETKNGVLTVNLPKLQIETKKKIEIKVK